LPTKVWVQSAVYFNPSIGWRSGMIGRVGGLPFMIGVWEVRTGTLAALLPLLLRRSSCLRVIEWADYGVSDYNCPSLGASAPRDLDGARAMWRTILDALPAADIVKFTRMPGALAIDLICWRTCRKPACAPYIATRLRCRRLGRTTSRASSGAFVRNFEEAGGLHQRKWRDFLGHRFTR
jgi:CelD/BcsL family acetyltransferase involved in cellulose biosynthesis